MSDFSEEFAAMMGKGEAEPEPAPEPSPTTEAEPEQQSPEQQHNDLLNELLAGRAQREQRLVDLLHPQHGDDAA